MMTIKSSSTEIESRPVQRLLVPFAHFAQMESAGSLALLSATIAALILANSRLSHVYSSLLQFPMGGHFGGASFDWTLRDLIDDALMALFFLLVGLEVKREILAGQLATARRAMLPLLGAIGGVLAPAIIYWTLNRSGEGARGWGIPIATDIAFALAIVVLFGKRVPVGLRMFLLTLAVVDDIAGVLVIAVAYSGEINSTYLAVAFLLFLFCLGLNRLGVVSLTAYLGTGAAMWLALYGAGVHATLAGIALALAIPYEASLPYEGLLASERDRLSEIVSSVEKVHRLSREARGLLRSVRIRIRLLESPLERMEAKLHPWVSFAILPLFALANAGVSLSDLRADTVWTQPIFYGVLLGLLIGKPLGITLICWIAVRLRIADLPAEVGWKQLHAVAWLGGIGFTVSIFIADLAFESQKQYTISRVAIFAASICAAAVGALLLSRIRPDARMPGQPRTIPEEESGEECA
jgi:NhaA family Na+:H+ antiporter